jgi:hypothetical protein
VCYRAPVLALPREAGLGWGLAELKSTISSRPSRVVPGVPADGRRDAPTGWELAGLGVVLAVAVALPLVAGLLVDQAAHSSPLGMLAGLLVGLAGAGAALWAQLKRYT